MQSMSHFSPTSTLLWLRGRDLKLRPLVFRQTGRLFVQHAGIGKLCMGQIKRLTISGSYNFMELFLLFMCHGERCLYEEG